MSVGSNGPIRVLLADDHEMFRRGLRLVMAGEDDIEVVGEADGGAQALALAEELAPDVVLMDVRMPDTDGISATRLVRDAVPGARIVMLTISDEEDDLYEAIKAGASGYLLKDMSIEEVADAVRAVAAGHSHLSPSMAAKLLTEFASLARRTEEPARLATPRLTKRETEVLTHVARGLANREIARELFISENTVKNHVRNILEKLHLHSRTEAVVYAVRERLLDIG